ncbi:MAG: TPM domain-containing protein [Candidatus Acidiferrales bacterium]
MASFAILCFLAVIASAAPQTQKKPEAFKPVGYVNDYANVLSQTARFQLTALCTEVDEKAHAQVTIVTVKSLDGQPIEQYSIDLATRWGIGPKQSSRGVLILLATDDRRYRFEVGYGLESILPDGKTGGFGREAVPYLREGNYEAAVLLMAQRVADVIAQDRGVVLTVGTSLPPPRDRRAHHNGPPFTLILFVLFIVFSIWGSIRRGLRGGSGRYRRGGGMWMGPMFGGGGGWGGGFGGGGGGGGGGGFGGFGGGSFGGGGASGSW